MKQDWILDGPPSAPEPPRWGGRPDGTSTRRRADGRLSRSARRVGHDRAIGGPRGFIVTRLRWIIVVTMAAIAAAAYVSWSQKPVYHSSAEVVVPPRVYSAGTAPQVPDMGTEKAIATSRAVLEQASRATGVPAADLADALSASVPLNTNVLHISYASLNPAQAQRRAQAVAQAYVLYWLAEQPSPRTTPRTATGTIAGAAIINAASLPTSPASPNHTVDMIIATIIGLVVAFGTAFIRDRLDDRLRNPHELEDLGAGPLLAVIPAVRQRRGDIRTRLVMLRNPDSAAARAYQDLRTLVFRAAAQRDAKTVLVTSPAGDRQTTVAANLAIGLTRARQRVTFVCGDMRWPHGHELFGEYNTPGLASVIEGRSGLSDALRATEVRGLDVLPAGWLEGDYGAALHGVALRRVLGRLRTTADFVVIDAPPALAGADTGALAELAEMVLVVGDARHTTRRQVNAMVGQLAHISDRIIGCVVDNYGRRTRPSRQPAEHAPVEFGADESPNGTGSPDWLTESLDMDPVSTTQPIRHGVDTND
jgi:polysaccharide biosynthesis transport protein